MLNAEPGHGCNHNNPLISTTPLAAWLGAFYCGAGKAARRAKPFVFGKGWGLWFCPQTWSTCVGISVES